MHLEPDLPSGVFNSLCVLVAMFEQRLDLPLHCMRSYLWPFAFLLLSGCGMIVTHLNPGPIYDDSHITPTMRDTLWDDAARLALNDAVKADSSFLDTISISTARTRHYYQDLVNLYNAFWMLSRDSVLNIYDVHPIEPELHI